MVQILGVDFSGAKADNNTWLTRAVLEGASLSLQEARRVTRRELTEILTTCSGPTVSALDFPFAPPRSFAEFWAHGCQTMPELWLAAAAIEYDDFLALRNGFVYLHCEPKRACDPPESYSCLHMVNPIMLPMTFRGMQMLHNLWFGNTSNAISVPPLPGHSRPRSAATTELLEVMPGAVLRRLGLPYKGYKGGARASERRQAIIATLPQRALPIEFEFGEFEDLALRSHDALDSIVAAVAAALWALAPSRFPKPPAVGEAGFDPVVLLEGWLYAPNRQA